MTIRDTGRFRAVALDAAGTLITVRRPVGETYADVARDHGANLDPARLSEAFRGVFATMPALAFESAPSMELQRLERQWWRELVRRVVAEVGEVDAFQPFFDALYDHYSRGGAWQLYPEVKAVLAELREAGLRIAVVSNFDSRLENILTALEVDRYLSALVYSSRAGSAKPDARIFELALDELGCAPGETLFVGDSMKADYHGALNAGLVPVLVDRGDAATSATDTRRVRDLAGIWAHLAGGETEG